MTFELSHVASEAVAAIVLHPAHIVKAIQAENLLTNTRPTNSSLTRCSVRATWHGEVR